MIYKKDEKIIKKLENQNYKGTKGLITELDERIKELENATVQDFVNDLYQNLSDYGIQKLDKVIERYNKEHPDNEPIKTYSQVLDQYKDIISDSVDLFLNYGNNYGEDHFTDTFIKVQFEEAVSSVDKKDMQNVIDEINKALNASMKSQGVSAVNTDKTQETFKNIVQQYGEENHIRTRISDFQNAEFQAEQLMKKIKLTDEEKKDLTEDEIASKKAHLLHDFKYNLLKLEKFEKPDDFQAIINILDRKLSFDERKALDSAVCFNNKENKNKYETRRIHLTEIEKDKSWQQFHSESVLSRKYREFRETLDELKKNGSARPIDKYDRGFINTSLRLLTNLQNFIKEVADFINDALNYYLPKEQNKEESNKKEKESDESKKTKEKLSPFHKIMEEAYCEKGFVESFTYEAGLITQDQAESLFITDIAYIKSLDSEQQEKLFGIYADGLMAAMKDERITANTKSLYQTFIAKYENGDYDKQIEETIKAGIDWTGVYSLKNDSLLKAKGIATPHKEAYKTAPTAHKKQAFKLEERDFAALEECTEEIMKMSKNIAYSDEKSADVIVKKIESKVVEMQKKYPNMNTEQVDFYKQLAAATVLTNSKYNKKLVDALSKFNKDNFFVSTSQSRVEILLKGAESIALSRQAQGKPINGKSNLCQMCAHKELKDTLERLTDNDKRQDYIQKLSENITSNRQHRLLEYALAVELKSLGLHLESKDFLHTDSQIDKAAISLLNQYSERINNNPTKNILNTYERLTTFFQMTSSKDELPGGQRFANTLQKRLFEVQPEEKRQVMMKLINKDIEKFNQLSKKYKETVEISPISENNQKNHVKSVLLKGLHENDKSVQEEEDLDVIENDAIENAEDENITTIDVSSKYTIEDIIDAFNNGDNPNTKFDDWVKSSTSMEELRKGVTEIDTKLTNQMAQVDFYESLLRNGIDNISKIAPDSEKTATAYYKEQDEQEL